MAIAFFNFQSAQSVEVCASLFRRFLVVSLLTCYPIEKALGEMHRSNLQRRHAWTLYAVLTICQEYQRPVFVASAASHRPRQAHFYQSSAMTVYDNNHSIVCCGVMAGTPNPLGTRSHCSTGKSLQFYSRRSCYKLPYGPRGPGTFCHGHREGRIANICGHDPNVITSLCNDR